MSLKLYCCLCCEHCNEYKLLENESGQSNEIYEMTVKYFDPMLLADHCNPTSQNDKIMCLNCWSHINDFHEFQLAVLKIRADLQDTQVKLEEELVLEQPIYNELYLTDKEELDYIEDDLFKSDLGENYDLKSESPRASDVPENPNDPLVSELETPKRTETKVNKNDKSKLTQKLKLLRAGKTKSSPDQCADGTESPSRKKIKKIRAELQDPQVKLEVKLVLEQPIYNELYLTDKEELDYIEDDLFKSDLGEKYDLKPESTRASDEPENPNDPLVSELETPKRTETKVNKNDKSKLTQKPKLLRARKTKSSPDPCAEGTESPSRKRIKLKDVDKPKMNSLEKSRLSDAFLAEFQPLLECDLCSEAFGNFDSLRNHFKDKHNNERCYFKCCQRKFFRRATLVNHIRLHINPETHKCDICGKTSTSRYNLKLHKKLAHEVRENEKFECDICHKTFSQKPYLERHLLITHSTGDKDFICPECGKGFLLETLLKTHIKYVHNDDHVCDQCGKTLHSMRIFKKHLMEHAGMEMPKYPCDECGALLKSRKNLKNHKASCHNDGSTVYICSICDKVSSTEKALKAHKKTVHDCEYKHKCTFCTKAFKTPKALREHVASHTGQDLYQCAFCPQTFKVSANMHHHRKRMHPKEWLENRKDYLQLPKIDVNEVTTKILILIKNLINIPHLLYSIYI